MNTAKNGDNGLHDAPYTEPPAEAEDLQIDSALLFSIARRRRWAWLVTGLLAFASFMGLGLYVAPQSFQSSLSLSMPQRQAGGLVSLLGSGGGGKNSYVGVLRSRAFAGQAEQKVNLQALYDLETKEDAIERLQSGLSVEDNASEGLLYVRVTLPGPPRLAPDPDGRRERVKRAAADAANFYARLMRRYLRESDTEEGSALLRAADAEIAGVRRGYSNAVTRLSAAVRGGLDLRAKFGGNLEPREAAREALVGVMEDLYKRRGALDEKITAARKTREERDKLLSGSPEALLAIPGEDKLLQDARKEIRLAEIELGEAQSKYKAGMPKVVAAQRRYDAALKSLRDQTASYLTGRSVENVDLAGLTAQRADLEGQIKRTEADFGVGLKKQTNLEKDGGQADLAVEVARRNVEIAAAALKATAEKHAELKLSHVSAQNRMTVVDAAIPARRGKPGGLVITALSLGGAVAVVGAWFALEYLARALAAAQRSVFREERVG